MATGATRLPSFWLLNRRLRPLQVISFPVLQLHMSRAAMSGSQKDFEMAVNQVKLLKNEPGKEVKLKLYALYKQATEGPCNMPKPGMLDFINKAKWDSWNALGNLSKETARQNYVELVSNLSSSEASSPGKPGADSKQAGYDTLVVTSEDGITKIMFNRPTKKNALNHQMYQELMAALEAAGKDDSAITVITEVYYNRRFGQRESPKEYERRQTTNTLPGTPDRRPRNVFLDAFQKRNGDYYSSGNDLNNFTQSLHGDIEKSAQDAAILLRNFVGCFIDFPKPLIAMVNGPAVGICVTLLGLFDVIYASDRATFHTPFSHLGQSPEGCASYMFPKIMGSAKASEMLLFGKKITAREACAQGLVTEVFPDATFQKEAWTRLKVYAKLPPNAMRISKQLIRNMEKEKLHAINSEECRVIQSRWQSEECANAIMNFLSRKAKL